MTANLVPENIRGLERPHPALWTYYIIISILTGPGIIASLPYLFFRYHTLRYRFDDEGIHMKVGILFQREINLTYARIQDIHLRSGILQRWLGLGNVQIQTASGSAGPELVIEGFKEYEAIRDFLYTRMRGYQTQQSGTGQKAEMAASSVPTGFSTAASGVTTPEQPEVLSLLLGIRDELRLTRQALESRTPPLTRPAPPSSSGNV